jgi:hypothetical protein
MAGGWRDSSLAGTYLPTFVRYLRAFPYAVPFWLNSPTENGDGSSVSSRIFGVYTPSIPTVMEIVPQDWSGRQPKGITHPLFMLTPANRAVLSSFRLPLVTAVTGILSH